MTKTIKKTKAQNNLSEIQQFATKSSNDCRIIDKIEVGQCVRQGDVYITRIENFSKVGCTKAGQKLAPGDTPGSRHFVDAHVTTWQNENTGKVVRYEVGFTCKGLLLECDRSFKVTHPEHAHFYLPAGSYEVSYQVNTKEMARVLD